MQFRLPRENFYCKKLYFRRDSTVNTVVKIRRGGDARFREQRGRMVDMVNGLSSDKTETGKLSEVFCQPTGDGEAGQVC
jgi:hypothetical protein